MYRQSSGHFSLFSVMKYRLFIFTLSLALAIMTMLIKPVLAERELLMITSDSCPFCMAWERDVGQIYNKSTYAKNLPLIRIQFGSSLPENMQLLAEVRGTPTFIILENQKEIDRIVGYSDAEMYWWQISEYDPSIE
jgi:thioredoxin-related protein